ncbi:hypothetical protein [Flavobacterium suncheonense]|uniref:hypothetical protein n=1 Tax=Flavobacterium suncheonense TaxID=350894 RepID=UPI00103FFC20|nr:hypothetical protein [Flavobacterium suncheonense]
MRFKFIVILLFMAFASCSNKEERVADSAKAEKLNKAALDILSKNWHFAVPPANPKVAQAIQNWKQWHDFTQELHQPPKGSLNAFRTKSKTLTLKGQLLEFDIPAQFNKPAVRSRIATLNTKLKSLETYTNLAPIQTDKVLKLIPEVSEELASIQNQLNEIIVKSEIPKEEGELIMLQALDTARHARREIQENLTEVKK